MDRSNAPAVNWEDPLALPHSTNTTTPLRARSTRKNTEEKLAVIHSQINTLSSDIKTMTSEIVQAIKSNPTSTQPTLLSGVNWTPILHGITNVIVSSLGGSPVSFPSAPKPAQTTSGEVQNVSPDLTPIIERMNTLETKLTSLSSQMETMLSLFWQDLINNNHKRTCYFHNFGGYDAILSMPALLNLPFQFLPISFFFLHKFKEGLSIPIKS